MARHMVGYVPDNPRYAPLTEREIQAMSYDDWLQATACETCRHRVCVDRGKKVVRGYERHDEIDVCVAGHDLGDGTHDAFELTASTVQETCPDWEMED